VIEAAQGGDGPGRDDARQRALGCGCLALCVAAFFAFVVWGASVRREERRAEARIEEARDSVRAGERERALAQMEEAIPSLPGRRQAPARLERAALLLEMGRDEESAAEVTRALEIDPAARPPTTTATPLHADLIRARMDVAARRAAEVALLADPAARGLHRVEADCAPGVEWWVLAAASAGDSDETCDLLAGALASRAAGALRRAVVDAIIGAPGSDRALFAGRVVYEWDEAGGARTKRIVRVDDPALDTDPRQPAREEGYLTATGHRAFPFHWTTCAAHPRAARRMARLASVVAAVDLEEVAGYFARRRELDFDHEEYEMSPAAFAGIPDAAVRAVHARMVEEKRKAGIFSLGDGRVDAMLEASRRALRDRGVGGE
jgi:hypothetical protein